MIAHPLWLAKTPLILASKSAGRRLALEAAGLPFDSRPADIDERAIEAGLAGADPDTLARTLAREKARAVSLASSGRLVIGADQVASCAGRIFGKPADMAAAAALLRFLSGRPHRLHSAVVLMGDGEVLFETVEQAELVVRPLSEKFIAAYLDTMGETALTSAGAYQIEGLGAHLFSRVAGDHWTIMGLPLLPLLDALRGLGAVRS